MKVIATLLGVSATTAMHYTEIPDCTEKLAKGMTSAANHVQAMASGDKITAGEIMGSLASMYKDFQDVNQVVSDCRDIANPEPKVITVHANHATNATTAPVVAEKNCLTDFDTLISDSMTTAKEIVTAIEAKSIPNLLTALDDIKKIEADAADARADCDTDALVSFVENTPCAKAMDKVVGKMANMAEDIKDIVSTEDLMKAHCIEKQLMAMPGLVQWVGKECNTDLQNVVGLDGGKRRRSIFDGLVGELVQKASGAVGELQKKAAEAACFGGSLAIAQHIKGVVDSLSHPSNTTTGTMEHIQGLHDQVNGAITSCQKAVTL